MARPSNRDARVNSFKSIIGRSTTISISLQAVGSVSNPVAQAKVWPWLMHCVRQDGACKMFDPLCGVEYSMKVGPFDANSAGLPLLQRRVGDRHPECDNIFVINPFTKEIVKLSMASGWYRFTGISFSSVPTSPDCVFLVCVALPKAMGSKCGHSAQ